MDASALKVASTIPDSPQAVWYLTAHGLIKRISSNERRNDDSGENGDMNGDSSSSSDNNNRIDGSYKGNGHKTNTVGIAVGVAVGVPVFLVIVILTILLWILYRRNKKEAKNDHDPEFVGDIEDLSNELYVNSQSSSAADENKDIQDSDSYLSAKLKRDMMKQRIQSIDPFRIPEKNDRATIREFGKRHDQQYGPYKITVNSVSSPYKLTNIRDKYHFCTGDALTSKGNAHVRNISISHLSSSIISGDGKREVEEEKELLSPCEEVTKNFASIENQFEVNKNGNENMARSVDALLPNNVENGQGIDEMNDKTNHESTSLLNEDEEEGLRRMKSVYRVYYEGKGGENNHETEIGQYPSISPRLISNGIQLEQTDLKGNEPQKPEQSIDPSIDGELQQKLEQSDAPLVGNELQQQPDFLYPLSRGQGNPTKREASSVYSAIPLNLSMDGNQARLLSLEEQEEQLSRRGQRLLLQQQQWEKEQAQCLQGQCRTRPQQWEQEQVQYQYPMQQPIYNAQAYFPSSLQFSQQFAPYSMQYGPPSVAVSRPIPQRAHPQTLESIDELPTPTNLPYSSSSLSLTSFKMKSRQNSALPPLQAARVHGTALNPMDHPEMFYTDNANLAQSGSQLAPYKMRQSVVMTNPSSFSLPTSFKPAGSIRNANGLNSRNNSFATQMNPYSREQVAYNSRVSGLLAEEDVFQPPNTSGILPRNGSHDDLRKQLGFSDNYRVI